MLGLDFGTSNSTAALPGGRVLPLDPFAGVVEPRLFRSVIYFPEHAPRVTYMGGEAVAEYLAESEGRFIQSVKAWLPSRSFTATVVRGRPMRLEDLVALLLRRMRESAEKIVGAPLPSVLLGRPALFSDDPQEDALAERRLREAAQLAGFTRLELMIEPMAAALAYEAQLDHDELVLVADFGAGTSDFTLMRLGPERHRRRDRRADIAGAGGVSIGGDKFDAAIMRGKLLVHFGAGSTYETLGKRLSMPTHILSKLVSWHEMSFIRERATQDLIDHMLRTSDRKPQLTALQDLVMENLGHRLFRAIEAAKIALSTADATRLQFDEASIHLDERLTRADFDHYAAPLFGRPRAHRRRAPGAHADRAGAGRRRVHDRWLVADSGGAATLRRALWRAQAANRRRLHQRRRGIGARRGAHRRLIGAAW